MIERLIDNWLDKASERAFEEPFRYLLASKGYNVLHKTRHCAMELGKDIIAIDAEGTVHAYQLKGTATGRLTVGQWQAIANQLLTLVTVTPNHPSLPDCDGFVPYLVVNGDIDEEVWAAIQGFNSGLPDGYGPLRTIVRGELRADFRELGDSLWPTTELEFKTFLELLLQTGREPCPKEKLAAILESVLPLADARVPKAQASRSLANAGILCAVAMSKFYAAANHVALIEAWTMFIAYVLAVADRYKLPKREFQNEFELAQAAIYEHLTDLCDELIANDAIFIEGSPAEDIFVYGARMTQLVGLMSLYGLWRIRDNDDHDSTDEFIRSFVDEHVAQVLFWGEAAVPQMLSLYWYASRRDSTSINLLVNIVETITVASLDENLKGLPSPYYDCETSLTHTMMPDESEIEDDFRTTSFALDPLYQLIVRERWKQRARFLWPQVSRVATKEFRPKCGWHAYRWDNGMQGALHETFPPVRQTWPELMRLADECEGKQVPSKLKTDPVLALLFLITYPHRISASFVRWLDTQLKTL